MANKVSRRVNGRKGEVITLEGDELSFKTGGTTEHMASEVVTRADVVNTEEARDIVKTTDMIMHGAWTAETPSTGGSSMFLVVMGRAHCWVMEITKAQVPNAATFAETLLPREKNDEDALKIPNRVINTPLGAVFTIGSIACLLLAVFLIFTYQQALLGLIAAAASIAMFLNIK